MAVFVRSNVLRIESMTIGLSDGSERDLFAPVKVGPLELPNRIAMSPMTRIRADEGCVPTDRMVRYYSQRASAGLIITEGTHPSSMGRGYTYPPGLHNEEQAAGWRKVTDAVHAAGGRIFVQLMHAGTGVPLVAATQPRPARRTLAIPLSGDIHTFGGKVPFETPRPLETEEIPGVVEEYRRAAELSITAGFDGVELHAATGYLPNQFRAGESGTGPLRAGESGTGPLLREKAGRVRYWQYGQAEKSPDLAISDPSRFLCASRFLAVPAGQRGGLVARCGEALPVPARCRFD